MSFPIDTTGTPPMIGKRLTAQEWLVALAAYRFPVTPAGIVLHHTWKPTVEDWRGLASMQGMQRFYAGKGWLSAPHLYVAPDGIWLFTPLDRRGIHAGNGNALLRNGRWTYTLGIEMVGNYDFKRPDGAVWLQTKIVLASLCRKLGGGARSLISFHRDYTSEKSCPGWAVTKEWVWAEVGAALTGGTMLQTAARMRVRRGVVALVREAPRRDAPVALGRDPKLQEELARLEAGWNVDVDPVPTLGESVNGNARWWHLVSSLGWIHDSALEAL